MFASTKRFSENVISVSVQLLSRPNPLMLSPSFKQHLFETVGWDKHGILHQSKRHVFFTQEEEERGKRALQKFGLDGEKYICIYARDEAYKKSIIILLSN